MYFSNIKYCLKMMGLAGVHPKRTDKMQNYLFLLNVSVNIIVLSLVGSVFVFGEESLTSATSINILETSITFCHGILKLIALKMHKSKIQILLRKTTELWKIEKIKTKYVKKACLRIMKYLSLVFYIMAVLACLVLLCFMLPSLLTRDKKILEIYQPKIVPKPLIFFLQNYAMVFGVYFPVLSFDIFYLSLIIIIKVQFKMLNYRIRVILKGNGGNSSIRNDIKIWVDYHNYLLDFVNDVNNTFSTTLLLYFGIIILTLSIEALQLTSWSNFDNILKAVIYLTVALFEFTVLYCAPGQLLIDEVC